MENFKSQENEIEKNGEKQSKGKTGDMNFVLLLLFYFRKKFDAKIRC